MGEVGEGDDAALADAQHLRQHLVREVQGLQRLGHHHHVEAVAGEVAQALVEVLLDDVDALGDALGDVVRVDLQAIAADPLVLGQPGEQFAIAAAEVEYPAAGGDPVLDDVQVGSHGRLILRFGSYSC
ncbi:hypothetical protein D3C84_952630 [compost metagenome]